MGLLKEEPSLLYMYEYIKEDKSKKEDLTKVIPDEWNIGDMIYTTNPSMDKNYYKFAATYRRAFVGDMQHQFDEAYGCDNMRKFAEGEGGTRIEYVVKYKEVIVKENIFKQFEEWIKEKWDIFRKHTKEQHWEKESDRYYEDLFKKL